MNPYLIFSQNERAQSLLEYAIILVLVAVAVVVVLGLFGADLGQVYQNLVDALKQALDPG
jgi:pilus assembly protein Flp/PilA